MSRYTGTLFELWKRGEQQKVFESIYSFDEFGNTIQGEVFEKEGENWIPRPTPPDSVYTFGSNLSVYSGINELILFKKQAQRYEASFVKLTSP